MTLRRSSFVFATVLTVIGAAVAVTLIVLTSNLRHAAHQVESDIESLRIGEELELGLVSLRDAREPLARSATEELVRRQVVEAAEYVSSDRERDLLANVEQQVDRYMAALDRATIGETSWMRIQEQTRARFEAAVAATRAWLRVNVEQSRNLRATAARWDQLASVIGTAAIVLLLVGLGSLGIWLQRRAFRPALKLVGAIDRYARGERTVRASEQGPEEFRTIAHRFNDMASTLERQRAGQLAFLAGVAHDIRNPLAALKLATAALPPDQALPPEPRLRQVLARIDRQIDRLDRMVYDFLDASRVESGNLDLQLDDHDIRSLARATLDLFEPATRTHELVLDVPDAPVRLRCDAMRIEQVLTNLVSNAIKYSPKGGPVRVAIEPRHGEVAVVVADKGVGMSPDDIEHAFEPFRRAAPSTDAIPGAGLGLFVARRIVEAHGGRIVVESAQGAGSTFTVLLPVGGAPA
jgi:signal transduction histidine kinase